MDLGGLQQLPGTIPTGRDGMTLGKLDGHAASLPVCPDAGPPSECLPRTWAGE